MRLLWLVPHRISPCCLTGGFNHTGSGHKTFLICHVISRDHMSKGLCEFIGGSP